jgi:hypothetical protein
MRRLLLATILLGCGSADPVDPPTPAPPIAARTPAADVPPTGPAPTATPLPTPPDPTPAPAASAAIPVRGEPWVQAAGDPRQPARADALTFWGWDEAGTHYAFETVYGGAGATECEGRRDLYVVDATQDAWAKDGHLFVQHDEPEPADGVCQPRDLAAAMADKRAAHLQRHGIVVGRVVDPVPYRGGPERWTLALPSGPVALDFAVLYGDREAAMGGPGAAYRLAWAAPSSAVIEPGARRRNGTWTYSLQDAWAFPSPDGEHVALLVARRNLDFEGDRLTWMSNGVPIPR